MLENSYSLDFELMQKILYEITPKLEQNCILKYNRTLDNGICYQASKELESLLEEKKIKSKIVLLPNHCVLHVRLQMRDYVIDPTIRQYFPKLPKIWFGRKRGYLRFLKSKKSQAYFGLYKNLTSQKLKLEMPFPFWHTAFIEIITEKT